MKIEPSENRPIKPSTSQHRKVEKIAPVYKDKSRGRLFDCYDGASEGDRVPKMSDEKFNELSESF